MRIAGRSGAIALLALLMSAEALAYVGPGAGLTLLSALWGLLAAVLAALAFLVVWPIRRWRRRRQAALEAAGIETMEDSAGHSRTEEPSHGMERRREGEAQ